MSNTTTKQCSCCNTIKSLDSFYFMKENNKYKKKCKECCLLQKHEYYIKNKKHIAHKKKNNPYTLIKAKEYRDKNKEELAQKRKIYVNKNKEKIAESTKKWQIKNKDRQKATRIKYEKTKSFKISRTNSSNKRRFIMKNGELNINIKYPLISELQSMLDNQNNKCVICNIEISREQKNIQLDHIKPLAKGGTHTTDNVQWLCADCNRNKSDKWVSE